MVISTPNRDVFSFPKLWPLYPAILGQAIPSAFSQFRVAVTRGEAAAIVLARQNNGILASNNLSDVVPYVKKYGLQHITTADILVEALHGGLITEKQGNAIWANMLQKQRKLPGASLTDYINGINGIT